MTLLNTLRGRLIAAMLLILVVAVSVSTVLDREAAPRTPRNANAAAPPAEDEAIQDIWVLAGFALPALALIWLVSSWSLRPLDRASQEAKRIGPRDPSARLSRAGLPAEVAPLVDAVNGALDRMADAFAAERRFTENAAHELRTPLAVLGLRLQRARQDGGAPDWPAIDRDLVQMNRLVSQLLDLARKENAGRGGQDAEWAPVNLSRIAREAAAMILPMTEAQGRKLRIDLPETLPARGQADDLRDAVRNLLENAVLHGAGAIGLSGRTDGTACVLAVSDEGAGIAAGEEQAVFARFHKDRRSTGTGLGLAIVREVARSHGGDVAVLPGPGCRIELRIAQ